MTEATTPAGNNGDTVVPAAHSFDIDQYKRADLRLKVNGRWWSFPNDPDGGLMGALLRVENAVKAASGIDLADALDEGKRLILTIMRSCNEGVPENPNSFPLGSGEMLMIISFLSDGRSAAEEVADAIAGGLSEVEQAEELRMMREAGEVTDAELEEGRPLAPSTGKPSSPSAPPKGGARRTGKQRPGGSSRRTSAKPAEPRSSSAAATDDDA